MKYLIVSLCSIFLISSFDSTPLEMPSVDLKTLDGKTVNIKKEIEKQNLTIVCFWANWSSPSKRALDAINEKLPLWKDKYEVELIAVNYDKEANLPRVLSLVNRKKWEFKVLTDFDKKLQKVFDRAFSYDGVTYSKCGTLTPYLYLVDKTGNVVFGHWGYTPGDESKIEDQFNLYSGSPKKIKEKH